MAFKTIVLKGDPLQMELKADAAITPGMILVRTTTGIKKHATAGGNVAPKLMAIENSLEGQEIGDDYSTGDMCQFVALRPGDEAYALLADDETITVGEYLESHGDGMLKAHATASGEPDYPEAIVAVALEAVDTSSSTYEAGTRIHVEIV